MEGRTDKTVSFDSGVEQRWSDAYESGDDDDDDELVKER